MVICVPLAHSLLGSRSDSDPVPKNKASYLTELGPAFRHPISMHEQGSYCLSM